MGRRDLLRAARDVAAPAPRAARVRGPGVPDARREQIFVPFFTTKPGGSGIGLSLARHIVLAHGGQLDVRANDPRGTVFTVSLPAAH